jgi:hypothetical protein
MTRYRARSHGAVIQHARPRVEPGFFQGAALGLLIEVMAFVFVCVVVVLVLGVDWGAVLG